MTLMWLIYLVFTFIPAVKSLAAMSFAIYIASLPLLGFIGWAESDINKTQHLWTFLKGKLLPKWWLAVMMLILAKLIPNTEITAYMLAGYGVEKIAESEVAQNIGKDGVDLIKQMIQKAKEQLETKEK